MPHFLSDFNSIKSVHDHIILKGNENRRSFPFQYRYNIICSFSIHIVLTIQYLICSILNLNIEIEGFGGDRRKWKILLSLFITLFCFPLSLLSFTKIMFKQVLASPIHEVGCESSVNIEDLDNALCQISQTIYVDQLTPETGYSS